MQKTGLTFFVVVRSGYFQFFFHAASKPLAVTLNTVVFLTVLLIALDYDMKRYKKMLCKMTKMSLKRYITIYIVVKIVVMNTYSPERWALNCDAYKTTCMD
jgi:hypothetical protein